MTCCDHCVDAEDFFSERTARRELRKYRRKGPTGTTKHLVRMLAAQDVSGASLLDIGGGIGALQHVLIKRGASKALHVDASRAYLALSAEEAGRQGHGEQVEHRFGDFVDVAPEIPEFDIVTLDRVVCCYPDMRRLIEESASRARHLYGLSFPRAHVGVRAGIALGNAWFRLRRSSFRTFVHPPAEITAEVMGQGFSLVAQARTLIWRIQLFARQGPSAGD
jgi:hypothetical protein